VGLLAGSIEPVGYFEAVEGKQLDPVGAVHVDVGLVAGGVIPALLRPFASFGGETRATRGAA